MAATFGIASTFRTQHPLIIDLFDTWSGKSVAACKYPCSASGSRNYETFPVNRYEAESRRISRFFDFGHSINLVEPTVLKQVAAGRFVTKVNP
ncbi:MAG: transglutaminase family protein [Cyclobacteriaceae bacterium]|nr:transglutaminase family protein [Cyclobacteriaceae bacterium]